MSGDPNLPSLHEMEGRYLRDALFHARVKAAVGSLRVDLYGRPEGALSKREQHLAIYAAGMGLLMAEFDLNTEPSS